MPVHSRVLGILHILIEGICRHGNDGDVCESRIGQGANSFGCFVPVHNWHLDVHQYQIVVSRLGGRDLIQRVLAIDSRIHGKACG